MTSRGVPGIVRQSPSATTICHLKARPNARWSLDSVHDQFATGGRFRILNVVDDVTRECLAAIPDTSISGRSVVRELTALIGLRGRPAMIVSDNGAEFTSTAILAWAHDYRVNWQDIARGKPTQRVVGAAIRQDGRAAPLGRGNFAKSEPL